MFDAVNRASLVAIVDPSTPIFDTVPIMSASHSSTAAALATAVMHTVVTRTVFDIRHVITRLLAVGGLVLREVAAVQQLLAGLLLNKNISTESVGVHCALEKAAQAPRGMGLLLWGPIV